MWVNMLILFARYKASPGLKANIRHVERDFKFNVAVLRFIEGTTTSYYLILLLRSDMGMRIHKMPRLNWLLHYLFILIRLSVVGFCVFYLIPHWEHIEIKILSFLKKNEEFNFDNKKDHSNFN